MVSAPTQTGVDTLGGYDANLLALQIANSRAANAANLYQTAGYYDPSTLLAPAGATLTPTLARDQLNQQAQQFGVSNALDQRKLDAQIAQWANTNALDAGTLTGFYNGLPTLARQQLAATIGIANADNFRQWATMRGSQLLQQQQQDDAARATGAQARLSTLQLLASQKGPENWLAYNSLLNNLSSPNGQATDPFGIAARVEAGVAPRSTIDLNSVWNQTPPAGSTVAAPSMAAPAGAPMAPVSPGGIGSTSLIPTGGGISTGGAAPISLVPHPSSTGLAISGNPEADAALKAQGGWGQTDPAAQAEFDRISKNMQGAYATQQANSGGMAGYADGTMLEPDENPWDWYFKQAWGGGQGLPKYADGTPGSPFGGMDWSSIFQGAGRGLVRDGAFMAGDQQQGQQGANPEVVWNPTHAPVGVLPANAMPDRSNPGAWDQAFGQGMRAWMQQRVHGGGGAGPWGGMGGVSPPGGASALPVPDQQNNVGVTQPQSQPLLPPPPPRNGMPINTPGGQVMVNGGDQYWNRFPAGAQTGARLPAFATGTPAFSTDTAFGSFDRFTPQQIAGTPVVRKLQGAMPTNQWQGMGAGATTLPGSGAVLPGTFNFNDYSMMAPSERLQTQGLYETPRSQGGLGLDWNDIYQASQRAAPIGQRFGLAGYGW